MHMNLRLLLALLGTAIAVQAQDQPASPPDLSGTTDDSIRELIRRVSHHQLKALTPGQYPALNTVADAQAATMPKGLTWSYPWGVTLYGLIRSVDATGDKQIESFVLQHHAMASQHYGWLTAVKQKFGDTAEGKEILSNRDKLIIRPLLSLGNLDSCGAMGTSILEAMLRYPDKVTPEEKAVADRIADWIVNKQDRLPDGTFWRPKSTNVSRFMEPGTIWLDDLYMSTPFLVRWAKLTNNDALLHDAASQIIHMAGLLQDKDGLYFHGYFVHSKKHSPWKWGRANGWTMVATVEVLSALPENHPDRAALLDILRRQIEGVKAVQPESGVWHQVLDQKNLWDETSCTAMFVYSISRAVNRGWIDRSYLDVARKGFAGLAKHVTPAGAVADTCIGTNIGLDVEYYADREHPEDDHHGPGPFLLAATELVSVKK
jgi:unsaturated rhamnogalacturonyl hydrolase